MTLMKFTDSDMTVDEMGTKRINNMKAAINVIRKSSNKAVDHIGYTQSTVNIDFKEWIEV